MTIREELTRQVEKCLRQGRLDEAIALAQDLADLPPTDWGVVKLLADLLERAGQLEAASAQFARWADYLFAEGFHSKAAALYKKVLKLEPLHEHALWQLGEVSVALKLRADARVAFGRVAELRQRRHDSAGVEAARRRLETLDGTVGATPAPPRWAPPAPVAEPAAPAAPSAPVEPLAASERPPAPVVPAIADSLLAPVPPAQVLEPAPPREFVALPAAHVARPRDEALRLPRTTEGPAVPVVSAASGPSWSDVPPEDAPLVMPAATDPTVEPPRAPLVAWIAPSVAAALAEDEPPASTSGGDFDWADLLGRDLGVVASQVSSAAITDDAQADGDALVSTPQPSPALAVGAECDVEPIAVDEPTIVDDESGPTRADAAIVSEPPNDSPPVLSVDPDASPAAGVALLATIEALQAQPSRDLEGEPALPALSTPRAWLSGVAGVPAEAASRRHHDDPYFFEDAGPARWAVRRPAVSPQPPAVASQGGAALEARQVPVHATDAAADAMGTAVDRDSESERRPSPESHPTSEAAPRTPPTLDATSVEPAAATAFAVPEIVVLSQAAETSGIVDEEIDLTQLLEELKQWDPVLPEPVRRTLPAPADAAPKVPEEASAVPKPIPEPIPQPEPKAAPPEPADDPTVMTAGVVTRLFEPPAEMPAETADWMPHGAPSGAVFDAPAGRVSGADAVHDEGTAQLEALFAGLQPGSDDRIVAEQQLAAGRVFMAAGLMSEAARAFERASGEPRIRFEAARALGDLHQSRGQLLEAVRWFERAAGAPVPDAAVKRAVLYDLAESLEALGESDRALGVLLDLLSQVEDYRDARMRLDRLLRVDAGG